MADDLNLGVEVTWPYLAQEVDESLDPRLIEHHARQILARAAVHGRLVAFLGAGVSMAYGRLSWPELVFSVLGAVASINLERHGYDTDTKTKITARRETLSAVLGLLRKNETGGFEVVRKKAQELSGDKPLLVFHLCEDALQLACEADKRLERKPTKTLADVFKAQLGSPLAHDEKFVHALRALKNTKLPEHDMLGDLLRRHGDLLQEHAEDIRLARRYFLRAVRAVAANTEAVLRDKSQHDNGLGSPIALLLHEFRVQRYATTNYDDEIEAALATGLRVGQRPGQTGWAEHGSPVDVRQQSLVLGLDTAAAGLAFAVEGRRRHATVLHLHGHIDEPSTIIASERHYQRQYLRPSPRRDLIDNTIRSLFGANPVLYVGSGITEEDVLRPLREFMSRAPRRNDTLGVALLPANKDAHGLALQKIECLVRYGIHVIHYGRDMDSAGEEGGCAAWLHRFNEIVRGMKTRLEALAEPNQNDKPLAERLHNLPPVTLGATDLQLRHGMDGQPVAAHAGKSPIAIDLEVASLKALVDAWGGHKEAIAESTRDLLVQWVEEIASSVTTAFVCARLQTESEFRMRWADGLVRPITAVQTADPITDAPERSVYGHMTLDLSSFPGGVHNRFADLQMLSGELDKRWWRLRQSLAEHPKFLEHPGRRMVLMPVPRGAGKGSMFDQLTVPDSAPLAALHKTLAGLHKTLADDKATTTRWRTAVISLNFLSDVSNVAEAIARVISPRRPKHPYVGAPDWPDNVVATLEYALDGRTHVGRDTPRERVLIVLGNAGVLFDTHGEPKNGQVRRLMHLFTAVRFARAPIDFVVFCDEAHVPAQFRVPRADAPGAADDPASRMAPGKAAARLREGSRLAHPPWQEDAHLGERYERPNRLALRGIRMPPIVAVAACLSAAAQPGPGRCLAVHETLVRAARPALCQFGTRQAAVGPAPGAGWQPDRADPAACTGARTVRHQHHRRGLDAGRCATRACAGEDARLPQGREHSDGGAHPRIGPRDRNPPCLRPLGADAPAWPRFARVG